MPSYKTRSGKTVELGAQLGKGGEGTVYRSKSNADIAVKIYHAEHVQERREKILAMCAAGLASGGFAAFPIEPLFDNGTFVGFTMPVASQQKPVIDAYLPAARKVTFPTATFPFLLRVALNLAKAIGKVHQSACVIGDINESGVLVSRDATVTLIDADSFQFKDANGNTFLCKVGKPDYTPPELSTVKFATVTRTKNHDYFGLAVIIFHLLFLGKSPFYGQIIGTGDTPSLEDAKRQFRFAYSARHQETKMAPPRNSVTLKDIPLEMADAFEMAFGPSGVNRRPSADDWIRILEKAENQLQSCPNSKSHHYFKVAKGCPWCRIERGAKGFFAFTPVAPTVNAAATLNLNDLLARFQAVPRPAPLPDVAQLLPTAAVSPNRDFKRLWNNDRKMRSAGLVLAGIGGFGTVTFGGPWSLMCVFLIVLSLFLYFAVTNHAEDARRVLAEAETRWNEKKASWNPGYNTQKFDDLKQAGDRLVEIVRQMPTEEKRRLDDLHQQKRDAQLRAFLNGFRIDKAKIKGIGPSRLNELRSRLIETAADIELHKVRNIKGFGEALAHELMRWRRSCESKFVFNQNAAIDPNEIARVKIDMTRRQNDTFAKLNVIYISLIGEAAALSEKRSKVDPPILHCWTEYRQAQANLAAAEAHPCKRSVGAFAASVAIPLFFGMSLNFKPKEGLVTPPTSTASRIAPAAPGAASPLASPPAETLPQPLGVTPNFVPVTSPPPAAASPQAPSSSATEPSVEGSPVRGGNALPLKQVIVPDTRQMGDMAPPRVYSIDTSRPEVALAVQKRLHDLGYLSAQPDGVFGPASIRALEAFQIADKLFTGPLNEVTAKALFDEFAPRAPAPQGPVPPFLWGTWKQEPCGEPEKGAPIIFDAAKATVSGAACVFETMTSIPGGWRGRAVCTDLGQSWRSDVALRVQGQAMTWSSRQGTTRYFRCPASPESRG